MNPWIAALLILVVVGAVVFALGCYLAAIIWWSDRHDVPDWAARLLICLPFVAAVYLVLVGLMDWANGSW